MAKPDPQLLDPARYPFVTEVDVRFGDTDVNKHVNNVSLTGFIEEGRVRFHKASGYHAAIAGVGSMVASMAIEFLGQAFYPGMLTIRAGASRIGNTSYELELLLTQEERVVAFARSIMVCTLKGAPHPIPDAFRATVKDWMAKA